MKKNRPIVKTRNTQGHKTKEGYGFSLDEIKQAGLTLHIAELGIPIDKRRRTAHSENIQTLTNHFTSSVPLTEIKGIGKTIEEELGKENITDIHDLAFANIKTLTEKLHHSKKTLENWQSKAKKLLRNR